MFFNSKNSFSSLIIFLCFLLRNINCLNTKIFLIKVLINTCSKIDILIDLCVQLIIEFYKNIFYNKSNIKKIILNC